MQRSAPCVYACVCVCVRACVCVCVCICIYIYIYIYICVCVCARARLSECVWVRARICVSFIHLDVEYSKCIVVVEHYWQTLKIYLLQILIKSAIISIKLLYRLNRFQVTSEKINLNERFGHRRLRWNSVVNINLWI